jgi:hypothetical protein
MVSPPALRQQLLSHASRLLPFFKYTFDSQFTLQLLNVLAVTG